MQTLPTVMHAYKAERLAWRNKDNGVSNCFLGPTMLRKDGETIEASNGYAVSLAFAKRLNKKRIACYHKNSTWCGSMIDTQNGYRQRWRVSITHRGDVRVGCTLVASNEFNELAHSLGWGTA